MAKYKKILELGLNENYFVRFYTPSIGLDSYKLIGPIIKKTIEDKIQLIIDLSKVKCANGDFFGFLFAEYINSWPKEKEEEAIKTLMNNLTFIVRKESRVHETAKAMIPKLLKYKFV